MSLVAIRADVAQAIGEWRADQARPENERQPVPEPSQAAQAETLRGRVLYGEPLVLTDGNVEWWCYDDDRWPAAPPLNDDGTPKRQNGALRVYDSIPDGWRPVDSDA